MYDVVVVGARCAGASLAMLLARAGRRVALVDRAQFPSDTLSTHFLWQRGASRLEAWGLLDRLRDRGCEPITQITFDVGPLQMCGIGPPVGGVAETYCPRRSVLDTLLMEAAVEAGVELIEGFVVTDVVATDGRVGGVRGHQRGAPERSLLARLVVGADGLHSVVAARVGARPYRQYPALTGVYYSYWRDVPGRAASFHARPGRLVLVWPTNDGLTLVSVAWPAADFSEVRSDVEGGFRGSLAMVPGLAERIGTGKRVQRFAGTADLPNLYRSSAGAGWALAGDAGHHKDPSTGMGMSDAFVAAELLAHAVHENLDDPGRLDAALACYQEQRDASTANGYELTLKTAQLAPLPSRLEAHYRSAAGHPEGVEAIFGVLGGTVPVREVFRSPRAGPRAHGRAT